MHQKNRCGQKVNFLAGPCVPPCRLRVPRDHQVARVYAHKVQNNKQQILHLGKVHVGKVHVGEVHVGKVHLSEVHIGEVHLSEVHV